MFDKLDELIQKKFKGTIEIGPHFFKFCIIISFFILLADWGRGTFYNYDSNGGHFILFLILYCTLLLIAYLYSKDKKNYKILILPCIAFIFDLGLELLIGATYSIRKDWDLVWYYRYELNWFAKYFPSILNFIFSFLLYRNDDNIFNILGCIFEKFVRVSTKLLRRYWMVAVLLCGALYQYIENMDYWYNSKNTIPCYILLGTAFIVLAILNRDTLISSKKNQNTENNKEEDTSEREKKEKYS